MNNFTQKLLLLACAFSFFTLPTLHTHTNIDHNPLANEASSFENNNDRGKNDPLFNTKFLAKSSKVAHFLKEHEGFNPIEFTTPDSLTLEGLARTSPHSSYTVVVCAGFCPGVQTGMATLIRMLPKECDIYFFNYRGKEKSQGSSFNPYGYGPGEQTDIVSLLDYILKRKPSQPTILYGICGGGHHVAKIAGDTSKRDKYNICGCIVDSIPVSLYDTVNRLPDYLAKQWSKKTRLACVLAPFYKSLLTVTKNLLFPSFLENIRIPFTNRYLFPNPYKKQTITQTSYNCHLLAFHANKDRLSSFEKAKKWFQKIKTGTTHTKKFVTFDETGHALNHIKHQKAYKESIDNFFNRLKPSL